MLPDIAQPFAHVLLKNRHHSELMHDNILGLEGCYFKLLHGNALCVQGFSILYSSALQHQAHTSGPCGVPISAWKHALFQADAWECSIHARL